MSSLLFEHDLIGEPVASMCLVGGLGSISEPSVSVCDGTLCCWQALLTPPQAKAKQSPPKLDHRYSGVPGNVEQPDAVAEADICSMADMKLPTSSHWAQSWEEMLIISFHKLIRDTLAQPCTTTTFSTASKSLLLQKHPVPNEISLWLKESLYPQGIASKIPRGCVKPWVVQNLYILCLFI